MVGGTICSFRMIIFSQIDAVLVALLAMLTDGFSKL